MGKRWRKISNSTAWSGLLVVAGAALCAVVIQGFVVTFDAARRPRITETLAETPAASAEPEKPLRYVPPAEIEYPFF